MQNRTLGKSLLFGRWCTSLVTVVVVSIMLNASACTMNETQQRVGSGAVIGAAGGALLGGSRRATAIGTAVGAAGGYMVDQHKKRNEAEAENARLREENARLRQQTSQ
jgi:uncharacterized membrane protein